MNKQHFYWVMFSIAMMIAVAGCVYSKQAQASTPTVPDPPSLNLQAQPSTQTLLADFAGKASPHFVASSCVHPAGWQAYRVAEEETADSVAARFGITTSELLQGNCLVDAMGIVAGRLLYVPFVQPRLVPQTVLPLGISHFAADTPLTQPGGSVKLYWQAQGPVAVVRIGWYFNGHFEEQATALPTEGGIELTIPADGRDAVNYVLLVSDGAQEVVAQTTVRVACAESWFFAPQPITCPSSLLVTTFREQHFERGTIVYVPALGVHYVMVAGQEAVMMLDDFIPGMSPRDYSIEIPAGFAASEGPIHYIWRHEGVRAALGHAIDGEIEYPGLMQRSVNLSGEQVYFTASSGHVYRVGDGLVWGVIIPA